MQTDWKSNAWICIHEHSKNRQKWNEFPSNIIEHHKHSIKSGFVSLNNPFGVSLTAREKNNIKD